jgi:4-hydroxy-tetrahydrodipicolinate reductase
MATLVADAVRDDPQLELLARLATRPSPQLAGVAGDKPVIVDFTAAEVTAALLTQALYTPCPLVIGTSGLGPAERELIAEVGRTTAVVVAANFSVALLAVARFVRELSSQVGSSWDAGVIDVHFAGKRDRPSGTAGFLAEQWRGSHAEPEVASFRLGDAVSEHRLLAAGSGEHVEVVHRIADRRAFLPGILRSIRFASDAGPGVYSLEHVVSGSRRS